ncbi:MAG: Asp23/Gls24 family envelope stress response protein [Tissierellales bacterium]
MEIIALIGHSGSGKSYKAITLAKEKDIEYIIDDGLLIKGNKILAGKSAKREGTIVSAIRRAIFMDNAHKLEVINAIAKDKPHSILIIGTSDKMVNKISTSLRLPQISQRVYIEDISTEEEIDVAKNYRKKEGKHVIPVPTFEVKKDFSGYFIDSLKIWRKKENPKDQVVYEKTVVRPTFSYHGKYTISDGVIKDLLKHAASKVIGIAKVYGVQIKSLEQGIVIGLNAEVMYGNPIVPLITLMQEQIIYEVENMTSLNILSVDVLVKKMIKS